MENTKYLQTSANHESTPRRLPRVAGTEHNISCWQTIKRYAFHTTGALRRARLMARVIYTIKISLFCSQFVRKKRELASIKRYSAFAVSLYVRPWLLLLSQFRPQPTTLNLSSA